MADEAVKSVQVFCATCRYTIRSHGEVMSSLTLLGAERCAANGHELEVTIPAPSGTLADRFGETGSSISGRW